MKSWRQGQILDVIDHEPVVSQEMLREKLRDRGIEATQATISRDLKEIGLVKRAGDGAYVRPGTERAPAGARTAAARRVGAAAGLRARRDPASWFAPTAARRRDWRSGSTGRRCRRSPARSPATTRSSWCVAAADAAAVGRTSHRRAGEALESFVERKRARTNETNRSRVLGRPRHVGRHSVAGRAVPTPRSSPSRWTSGRARNSRTRVSARSASAPRARTCVDLREEFARDFILPALQAVRRLRGSLSAGDRARPAAHRQAPGRDRAASKAPRPWRTAAAPRRTTTRCGSRPAVEHARSVARDSRAAGAVGRDARRRRSPSPRSGAFRCRVTADSPYSTDVNLWGRSVEARRARRSVARAARGRLSAHARAGRGARHSGVRRARVRTWRAGRHQRRVAVARRADLERSRPSPARTASAGSTCSRIASAARSRARSTRRRPASCCTRRTANCRSTSRRATWRAWPPMSASSTPTSSTTATGTRPRARRSTRSWPRCRSA